MVRHSQGGTAYRQPQAVCTTQQAHFKSRRPWGCVKARQYAGRDGLPHAGEQTPPHPGGVFQIPAQLRPQRAILQAGAHHEEARPKEGGT